MTHSSKLKIEIIKKLEVLPEAKLDKVLAYIIQLNSDANRRKRILSFAGAWQDLDSETFDDLTIHLHRNRAKDIREF